MPTPGSHGFDERRTRLRGELDDLGIPDPILQRVSSSMSPGARSDRARGPYGERTGAAATPAP